MDTVFLPDHTSHVFSVIIKDHDSGIPSVETQTDPFHFIFIHDDKAVSFLVSPNGQNLLTVFIDHRDAWQILIHPQTDSRSFICQATTHATTHCSV